MSAKVFESTGWSRIDISPEALDPVEVKLRGLEIAPEKLDVAIHADRFREFIKDPAYEGDYRTYGGEMEHCFFEKALEHYLSFEIARPKPGEVGMDVGSCVSVVPKLVERLFGCRCYQQDLEYPSGIHGNQVGGSADAIPLEAGSIDFMFLHCTYEHFEGSADTGFVRECARLLRPGGRVVILPLYLNQNYCNITGETDSVKQATIGFDSGASFHCLIPEWQNRFGRHYSPEALMGRVWKPAIEIGLSPQIHRVQHWESIDPRLWLRWVLTIEMPV